MSGDGFAEHIARVVDEAPPLTPEQRDRLTVLLQGGRPPSVDPQVAEAMQAEQLERAAREQHVRRMQAAVVGCAGCGHPPAAHSNVTHEWVARSQKEIDQAIGGASDSVSSAETSERALAHLRHHESTSLRGVADALGIGHTTAQRAIRRLLRDGRIEIVRKGTGDGYPTTYRLVG